MLSIPDFNSDNSFHILSEVLFKFLVIQVKHSIVKLKEFTLFDINAAQVIFKIVQDINVNIIAFIIAFTIVPFATF